MHDCMCTAWLLSMPFQVLGLWLHLTMKYILLSITVTEINIKRYRNKKIKDVGMACQKYANKVGMI